MKTTKCFLAAAICVSAISFTFFACSSDDGGSSSGQGQQGGSGCSDPSATVVIGSQTWLKCNLNVQHNTGNGNSWCYSGIDNSTGSAVSITAEEGCAKYGRLYDWAAAMNLPSSCNSSSCASQIQQPKHRGLCPAGFHIPTNAEWDALYRAADGTSGTESPYDSPTAGSKLKSASGWQPEEGISSTDEFGFSALPGGFRYTNGNFYGAGSQGNWWSGAEDYEDGASRRGMTYNNDDAYRGNHIKAVGLSVRCLQD